MCYSGIPAWNLIWFDANSIEYKVNEENFDACKPTQTVHKLKIYVNLSVSSNLFMEDS